MLNDFVFFCPYIQWFLDCFFVLVQPQSLCLWFSFDWLSWLMYTIKDQPRKHSLAFMSYCLNSMLLKYACYILLCFRTTNFLFPPFLPQGLIILFSMLCLLRTLNQLFDSQPTQLLFICDFNAFFEFFKLHYLCCFSS